MNLVLYSRDNCHLCDAFEDELNDFLKQTDAGYKKVDVDSQQQFQNLYGNDVPVLTLDDLIICQHFFDRDKILKVIT